jgi:hypothetical protein
LARKPRPVDPAAGPIPAFAHDLRRVREEAGEPTYRALATLAGFSATTLSDAAGGVRFPSLEVTLAYVGACGGDVGAWDRRWHALDRALADERAASAAAGAPAAAPPVPAPAPAVAAGPPGPGGAAAGAVPATVRGALTTLATAAPSAPAVPELTSPVDTVATGRPPRPLAALPVWARWSAAATVLTLAAVVGLLALRPADGPSCPRAQPAGAFSGTTYLVNTLVRAGANRGAPVVAQAPAGCSLQFTGYCLGDVITDTTSGTADIRWFKMRDGGVVSSGVVHGNPPSGMPPSDCPDSVPGPAGIALTVVRPPGIADSLELRASGKQLPIVGFSAFFAVPDGSGKAPSWQQIGFNSRAGTAFATSWGVGPLRPAAAPGTAVTVVAVACLGGGTPTGVLDARQVPIGTAGTAPAAAGTAGPVMADLRAADLSPADRAKAEEAACKYPEIG